VYGKFLPYLSAQLLGAVVGAALVWLQYLPHWKETSDTGLNSAYFARLRNSKYRNKFNQRSDCTFFWFSFGAIFSKSARRMACRRLAHTWWKLVWASAFLSAVRPLMPSTLPRLRARLAHAILRLRQGRFRLALRAIPIVRPSRAVHCRVCSETFVDLTVSLPIPRHVLLTDFSGLRGVCRRAVAIVYLFAA